MSRTRIETADRPLVNQWATHVYVDHADLEAMPKWRLTLLRHSLRLLHVAVMGRPRGY